MEELTVAKGQEDVKIIDTDTLVYELKNPISFEDKEYKKFTFNFGKLTGNDAILIEAELEAQNIYIIAPETSRTYQARMAAKAAGVSVEILEKLSFKDFNRITNAARNFLVGQEL